MKEPDTTCSPLRIVSGRIASKIYRKKESDHLKRIDEIEKQAVPLRDALDLFPPGSADKIASWEEDFVKVQEKLAGDVSFVSTADVSLTWLQYILTRALKPQIVVETGVWIGSSSFSLLSALSANGHGKLISIDFPPFWKKNRVGIGRLVPESLYKYWELHLGPSQALLSTVAKPGSLDLFIHDSDHTYCNMMAEFEAAWELVRPGGYLVSDDSSMNDSVLDFAESKGCAYKFLKREKGGTIAIMIR
ncbi:class I SAM-dependent methyltransferase [Akkermansiaceae bacterium]|nr:class I SAM-dependent methyltransferase [Akkermansiaceae bacterium]MDB4323767.1 class I SAM-dependent methyltransferase [Akkermansiaceae bacterium]